MAVSSYFNHVSHAGEQKLANDLIVEAIQQRGVDCHYIPNTYITDETLFNEAEKNLFSNAKLLEFYVESISNFNGEGDIFSKFGLDFTDSAVLCCSKTRFAEEFTGVEITPQPGDVIFIDMARQAYEVEKILEDEDFKQQGLNKLWRFQVQKFRYGHETLDSGFEGFDTLESSYELPELDTNGDPTGILTTPDTRDRKEILDSSPIVSTDVIDFGRS